MRVSGDWLTDPATQGVCAMLTTAGHQALLVGGCVRNALLGVAVTDIDIATDATPDRVVELARAAGLKPVPTGIDHGTITVVADGKPHEVTTFRRDVETDGRHATVAFSTDVAEDAARRDFTMNAIYARADGTVVDPLGGLPDLRARHVRFVGDPDRRIREDYLRILRFFRFTAWYGDPALGMDADGLAACAAGIDGLHALSKERVGAEIRKLLSAPDPAPAVASMARAGILNAILPGTDDRAFAPLVHLEGDEPPRWLRRLAVLGGDDPTDALRLSRHEQRDLATLRDGIAGTRSPAALAALHGATLAGDTVLLRAALLETPPPPDWRAAVVRGAETPFPVTAADLPHLSGPALGAELKRLKTAWLSSDLRLTRSQLLG
ncbi:CCA tRNA nucleotidyltransferase [Rhodobacteraceae bacterium HSP-20]|uniref:CCA tRNA nucleotidyltransferase n=1 Tax=Paragemmobacter amnigenus TaxID=2852097 RepID=A0ABS6J3E1_9RHOB|nr:CCA tRNA nucleotidyltransferase [Rhodobacter amnigenus]MBU9698286.1 CCA tRNA nucleotidyltransferase [Rhodobacter amnigenus]MBV4389513.1 CCA tRNA nucleotidyltransferase [Rhodobacter amnigenus]